MKNKEEIYDNQISPLMKQIINICKKHRIPVFAQFQYSDEEFATTSIPTGGHMILGLMAMLSRCVEPEGVNIDKFLLAVMREYPNKSSALIKMLQSDIKEA